MWVLCPPDQTAMEMPLRRVVGILRIFQGHILLTGSKPTLAEPP